MPTLTKLICLTLGAALGILFGIGIGSDVIRYLRDRAQKPGKQQAQRLGVAVRGSH
jgi:hypothetical protein